MCFSDEVSHKDKKYCTFDAGFLFWVLVFLFWVLRPSRGLSLNIFPYLERNELRVGHGQGDPVKRISRMDLDWRHIKYSLP